MNDNFKCIYKILKTLEKAMDYPEFDISQIIISPLTFLIMTIVVEIMAFAIISLPNQRFGSEFL